MGMKEEPLVGVWDAVKNVIEMEQNKGEVSCDLGVLCLFEF